MRISNNLRFFIVIFIAFGSLLGCNEIKESEIKRVRFGLLTDIHLPTMHDSERRMNAFIDSMRIAEPDFIRWVDSNFRKKHHLCWAFSMGVGLPGSG